MASHDNHLANIITGAALGALIGGAMGLGVCMFVFEGTLLFEGDTVLAGAVICGSPGYYLATGSLNG